MTGKTITCEYCNKSVYKSLTFIKNNKNLFCSKSCANKFQGRNKINFICKICHIEFRWSKSRLKQLNPIYCSISCRNKDEQWKYNACIMGNLKQQTKKGLNKLELAGSKIISDLGIQFKEQVLIANKFLVDVFIPDRKLIIQWDGDYWHNKDKRKQLDKSQDAYLLKCGYKILRFWEHEVKNNKELVTEKINRSCR